MLGARAIRGIIRRMLRSAIVVPEPADQRTRVAMLRAFFETSHYSLMVALLIIGMQCVYAHDLVPLPVLAAWVLGAAVLLATRWHWRVHILQLTDEQLDAGLALWTRRAIAGAGCTGLMWSLALLMDFQVHDTTAQMFCATIACLTCVGSINVMAPLPRAFHALLWPVVLTLSGLFLGLALQGEPSGLFLVGLVLLCAALASGLAHRHAKLLFSSHALRYEREAMLQQLEEANTAKSRFLAAASHDLRQPLHALGLLAVQLHEDLRGRRARHTAERLETIVGSLDSLVDALLDISRLDSRLAPVQLQPVALSGIFDRLAAEFAPLADERALQCRLRPTSLWVMSDELQLERMLRNLLSNAMRYTQQGGVLLAARTLSTPLGPQVRISIWDTGPGIAPEHQLRVFEEFVQLNNPGRIRSKGLGLGLSIVARIGKLLQHPVGLRSRVGRGSCFSVDVPLAAAPAVPPMTPLPLATGEPLNDLGVVLVEDDVEVREATLQLLQRWGCRVVAAADAAAAAQLPLDGMQRIVCDWRLAQGDGLSIIAALRRRRGAAMPALMLSGETVPAAVAEQAQRDGVTLARKPLPPAALRAWLSVALPAALSAGPGASAAGAAADSKMGAQEVLAS
jgi:signal transduction histidine kinase/CheY-like chemotaxis protein